MYTVMSMTIRNILYIVLRMSNTNIHRIENVHRNIHSIENTWPTETYIAYWENPAETYIACWERPTETWIL